MKKIISILVVFVALHTSGQSNDSATYSGRFDLGFAFSPDYGYRILKTGPSDDWIKNIYDTLEVPRYSYTAGLNIVFHINKNLFLSSGLLFADKGEKTKKYAIQPANNYVNHYYYLDIPLKAQYYLLKKNIKLFLAAGISGNVYINGESRVEAAVTGEKKPIGLSTEMSHLSFSFVGGFGLDCPITQRWYFRLEPNYRRSITPVSDAPVKKYFYSAGLSMGFFCKI